MGPATTAAVMMTVPGPQLGAELFRTLGDGFAAELLAGLGPLFVGALMRAAGSAAVGGFLRGLGPQCESSLLTLPMPEACFAALLMAYYTAVYSATVYCSATVPLLMHSGFESGYA